jgi:catechol 2,3-dioxygenase-like lactoylglutathione lyase family enzyme
MTLDVRGMAPLLQVFDMPTSIEFYCDLLGFEVVGTSGGDDPAQYDWAMIRLYGIDVMLNTAYERDARPPKPDPRRIAAHDDVCLYFGAPNVDAVYEHVRAKGIECKPPKVAPYGLKQLYFHDPDGYQLCFQWPETEQARVNQRKLYPASDT